MWLDLNGKCIWYCCIRQKRDKDIWGYRQIQGSICPKNILIDSRLFSSLSWEYVKAHVGFLSSHSSTNSSGRRKSIEGTWVEEKVMRKGNEAGHAVPVSMAASLGPAGQTALSGASVAVVHLFDVFVIINYLLFFPHLPRCCPSAVVSHSTPPSFISLPVSLHPRALAISCCQGYQFLKHPCWCWCCSWVVLTTRARHVARNTVKVSQLSKACPPLIPEYSNTKLSWSYMIQKID